MVYCRGQGAFEYLLLLGGIVFVATIVIMIMQGSVSDVNNTLVESSNNYISVIGDKQQSLQDEYLLHYKVPAGCSYSNPPCLDGHVCNATNNSCYVFVSTTRNGCDYANPNCTTGYYCKYNFCLPNQSEPG